MQYIFHYVPLILVQIKVDLYTKRLDVLPLYRNIQLFMSMFI